MSDFPGLPHARAGGARTLCGTPLRRQDKAFGVLIVFRDRLQPFTTEELALQQTFADQAVIAIENARLFNETNEALKQQTATADVLRRSAARRSIYRPCSTNSCGPRPNSVALKAEGLRFATATCSATPPFTA